MSKLSTILAADPAVDLAVVREMASEFQNYILSDEVYHILVVRTRQGDERIQSSGGDLLARLNKLQEQITKLTPEQQDELRQLRRQLDESMADFRTRFHSLLEREVKARLNSLNWFLDECKQDQRQCRVSYPFEIRNRHRIDAIWDIIGDNPPEGMRGQIEAVDRRIRSITSPAEFVWDDQLKGIYPQGKYWYLYVLPSVTKE
ncbi:hypothetical protein GC175_03215 [bacterium]|nr:hypothetical protein [bacterium]